MSSKGNGRFLSEKEEKMRKFAIQSAMALARETDDEKTLVVRARTILNFLKGIDDNEDPEVPRKPILLTESD